MKHRHPYTILLAWLMGLAVALNGSAGGAFVERGIGIKGELELGKLYKQPRKGILVVAPGEITKQLERGRPVSDAITIEVDDRQRIVQMAIRDPYVITEKFIRITSPARDVLKAYGLTYDIEKFPGRVVLRYTDIGFEINQDTEQVVTILVYKPMN